MSESREREDESSYEVAEGRRSRPPTRGYQIKGRSVRTPLGFELAYDWGDSQHQRK